MIRYLLTASCAMFLFLGVNVAYVSDAMAESKKVEEHKIEICHVPPGNPENMNTISIDESAWSAYKAHGDKLGECSKDDKDKASKDKSDKDKASKEGNDTAAPKGPMVCECGLVASVDEAVKQAKTDLETADKDIDKADKDIEKTDKDAKDAKDAKDEEYKKKDSDHSKNTAKADKDEKDAKDAKDKAYADKDKASKDKDKASKDKDVAESDKADVQAKVAGSPCTCANGATGFWSSIAATSTPEAFREIKGK
ncbi:MAG: hypothetical protein CO186_00820 [Zetaproteobacteria bacterium CG_4_9_14_3_um_filter_49_83]|nr:MAG: hypothetical protein COW62_13395 [Zetaproteobacteria bacterium CG17_big_fil_post_rev_8_21_14_2_50_50_13]PIY56045.1 MAG: hypothetical protein COZ00_06880 [Zetaproteobacteria bacterium CG_4_10_14_0_8_um_filter_49_80]PJA36279.1 MAG: hypothetical protein CO186_00820 [Zetaproteobacteria bacterium CG_4_9_14_3_um_filter_49_83]